MTEKKEAPSIDSHLYNPERTEKAYNVEVTRTRQRQLSAKTSFRYRLHESIENNGYRGFASLVGNTANTFYLRNTILVLALIAIAGSGLIVAGMNVTPLVNANPAYDPNGRIGPVQPGVNPPNYDPSTILWHATSPASDASEFNMVNGVYCAANCHGVVGRSGIDLTPTVQGTGLMQGYFTNLGTFSMPTGKVKILVAPYVSTVKGFPGNLTITFNVSGFEYKEPGQGVQFSVTTTGILNVEFRGIKPTTVTCSQCGSPSYSGTTEIVPYKAGANNDVLTVIWTGATPPAGAVTTAVALSKSPVDLSVAAGKELQFVNTMRIPTNCCTVNQQFGFYLTTNATLPLSPNYDPRTDPSVGYLFEQYVSSGSANNWNVTDYVFLQRGLASSGNTIASQDSGSCAPSGSCFLGIAPDKGYNLESGVGMINVLNYTANAAGPYSGCTNANPYDTIPSPGCSLVEKYATNAGFSQLFPWLKLTNYYVGYYIKQASPTSAGETLNVLFDLNSQQNPNSMAIAIYLPLSPTCSASNPCANVLPTVQDTSLLGGAINALLSGWHFVSGSIGSLWNNLVVNPTTAAISKITLSIFQDVLSALSVFYGALANAGQALLNAVGNVLGIGNLGNIIANLLHGFGGFFGISTISLNIFSFFLSNGIAFVTLVYDLFSFLVGGLLSTYTGLANIATSLSTIFNLFWAKVSISSWLFMDLLWGSLEALNSLETWYYRWVRINYLIFIGSMKAIYWIAKQILDVALAIKDLLTPPAGVEALAAGGA